MVKDVRLILWLVWWSDSTTKMDGCVMWPTADSGETKMGSICKGNNSMKLTDFQSKIKVFILNFLFHVLFFFAQSCIFLFHHFLGCYVMTNHKEIKMNKPSNKLRKWWTTEMDIVDYRDGHGRLQISTWWTKQMDMVDYVDYTDGHDGLLKMDRVDYTDGHGGLHRWTW